MMIDKTFCKYTHGRFGRSMMSRKGKSITIMSIYSNKNKLLSFPQRKWFSVVTLPPGCWLVTPREWFLIWGSVLISAVGRSGILQQL